MPRNLKKLLLDDAGGTAVYVAFFTFILVGAGALSIDFGRMTVLRTQMQNRADAGAQAGAVYLDGRPGARNRAIAVARDVATKSTLLAMDSTTLSVQTVNFYSSVVPLTTASGDDDSKFIEVVLEPRNIALMFEPVLNKSSTRVETLNARAVATANPFICHAPPLMVCDPGETNGADDLTLPANVGRQIALKPAPASGFWAAGNYGLLALPDGSKGANDLYHALAAVQPQDCYSLDVTTATGVKMNKIKDGINARFELPAGTPDPAPNVINYPQDPELAGAVTGVLGSGDWDQAGYWAAKHGGTLPAALADGTRYQTYLYELGETFARNGRLTVYPVDSPVPPGYTLITPPGAAIPVDAGQADDPDHDGMPAGSVAANGPARRLVQVAVLQCQSEGVKGSHTYPTNGRYVEMFVTQAVPSAPEGTIYGELVTTLHPDNDPDFHANVTLVE